ncbi:DUF7560 family zinc ribbon protein [Halodesulfurarchaeum sp.]|uniref:DUF7560 family zinc ribbon protein n=1 Tax=Halodesulfurarchaeum sp. TaxID=1980530 RepID=UPI001BB90AED|nr:hypothetical protein [Halodesulfurarchaeum sp.]
MSRMGPDQRKYQFNCPRCDLVTIVGEDVREDMLAVGCYLCGADVGAQQFSPIPL